MKTWSGTISMKLFSFVKKELVFFISATAAVITCFFVHPSANYIQYIDWNTLALLFSLMTVVAGLRRCGVFVQLGNVLCARVKSWRSLCGVLVFLCFFLSMFVTNDVSLITFVPFAIALLVSLHVPGKYIMFTVILQTVAANCGSMLTPIGNPQNLFLYGKMHCGLWQFMRILLPFTIISFVLLLLSLLFIPRTRLEVMTIPYREKKIVCMEKKTNVNTIIRTVLYVLLFITSILSVLGVLPKWCAAVVTFLVVLAIDRTTFLDVDYMLLLTFVAFFIFTGNIQHLHVVKQLLEKVVQDYECTASVVASQVISNVPAALLLYPFSKNVDGLLCGVDIGGLGTLVASLASLISFKIYAASIEKTVSLKMHEPSVQGQSTVLPSSAKYLGFFTIVNSFFLAVLLVWYFLV